MENKMAANKGPKLEEIAVFPRDLKRAKSVFSKIPKDSPIVMLFDPELQEISALFKLKAYPVTGLFREYDPRERVIRVVQPYDKKETEFFVNERSSLRRVYVLRT